VTCGFSYLDDHGGTVGPQRGRLRLREVVPRPPAPQAPTTSASASS